MDSVFLQKQVRDNAMHLQEFYKDLENWGDQIKKRQEYDKKKLTEELSKDTLSATTTSISSTTADGAKGKQTKRIKSSDYKAWEKFDVEAYCANLDKESDGECSSAASDDDDAPDQSKIDLAMVYKNKGNAFVKQKIWKEAIVCYTQAIDCYAYDPVFYANRSLAYLKLGDYRKAEADSTAALQIEKTYVKAYQRRGTARELLQQPKEAYEDFQQGLKHEPKNSEIKGMIQKLVAKHPFLKTLGENQEPPRPKSQFTLSRQNQGISAQNPREETKGIALKDHVIEHAIDAEPMDLGSEQIAGNTNQPLITGSSDLKVVMHKPERMTAECEFGLNTNEIIEVMAIRKSAKTRSKVPLRRMPLVDVDMKTEKEHFAKKVK